MPRKNAEMRRAYWRQWWAEKKSANNQKQRARYQANRERIIAYQKKYRAEHPEKVAAWTAVSKQRAHDEGRSQAVTYVNHAIRSGRLIRAEHCSKCGAQGSKGRGKQIEAHHYRGYARERWLDVIWLCKDCHEYIHRELSS